MFGPLTAIALMSAPAAHAVEVSWDGHYRTAFRTFNSLSLSDEKFGYSEGIKKRQMS